MGKAVFRIVSPFLLAAAAFCQTPAISGVASPAGAGRAGVAVGSLATIFGSGLASRLAYSDSMPLSTTVADVASVTVNGTAVPVSWVSETQVNVQIPWEVTPGPATVVVTRTSGPSQPFNVNIDQFAPAVMSVNLGRLQAIAVNSDGSLAAASGLLPGLSSHPATAGDTITFWATGLGPVSGGAGSGRPAPDKSQQTTTPPVVLIGGVQAEVTYAGLSTQFVGVYQVNVVVPKSTGTGAALTLQVQAGGVTSPDPVTIAVQ